MLHWGYWLGIALVAVVFIVFAARRWMACAETELELFQVMSNDSVLVSPSSTGANIVKDKLTLTKGQKFEITGDFEKSTLHIIPHTAKGMADTAKVQTVKFGCWGGLSKIVKLELLVEEATKLKITASNKDAHETLALIIADPRLVLYHHATPAGSHALKLATA